MPAGVLRATSRLVLIDAVVSDSSGNAVTGLRDVDFQVFENGGPQQIRVFEFHDTTSTGADAKNSTKKQSASDSINRQHDNLYSNIEDKPALSVVPTIIVVDSLNTDVLQYRHACEQISNHLRSMSSHQLVAIYVVRKYLRVIQDFTWNASEAAAALDKYNKDWDQPLSHAHELKVVNSSGDTTEQSMRGEHELTETEAEIDKSLGDSRVRITLEALQDVARAASGYHGRKNLIWISSGFPLYSREGGSGPLTSYEELLRAATNGLADAQVAVYPIDPRGLAGSGSADFSFTGTTKSGGLLRGSEIGSAIQSKESALLPVHEAMDQIAQTTGGRAAYSSNFLDKAVDRASKDGGVYYTLGYYPTNPKWDGTFRGVKVSISGRPRLQVRARHGYFATGDTGILDDVARQRLENELVRSLRVGVPEMRALPLIVKTEDRQNDGRLAITYLIPAGAISLRSNERGKREGDLEYAVRVYASGGKQVSVHAGTFHASLTSQQIADASKELLSFSDKISLPTGSFLLKIGTIDMHTGLIGTLTIPKRIAHAAAPTLKQRVSH